MNRQDQRHFSSIVLLACLSGFCTAVVSGQEAESLNEDRMHTDGQVRDSDENHPVTTSQESDFLQQAVKQIVERTNSFREQNDRPTVQPNQKLSQTATYFAKYMARTGNYGHRADGQRPSQRALERGYEYCLISENIAFRYRSGGYDSTELAKQFTQGWIESEGHRENMLDAAVTDIGVAIARDDQTNYFFAVQMFGRPKSKAIEFTVVNQTGRQMSYEVSDRDGERKFELPPRGIMQHTRCDRPSLSRPDDPSGQFSVSAGDRFVFQRIDDGEIAIERRERTPSTATP